MGQTGTGVGGGKQAAELQEEQRKTQAGPLRPPGSRDFRGGAQPGGASCFRPNERTRLSSPGSRVARKVRSPRILPVTREDSGVSGSGEQKALPSLGVGGRMARSLLRASPSPLQGGGRENQGGRRQEQGKRVLTCAHLCSPVHTCAHPERVVCSAWEERHPEGHCAVNGDQSSHDALS